MDSSNNSIAGAEPGIGAKSKALMAATELEQRKHDLSLRLESFEAELHALREIRDSLADEERILTKRLVLAKKDRNRVSAKADSGKKRTMEMLEQVEGFKREIAVFERRCAENAKREQDLAAHIATADEELMAAKRQISYATEELETGRETLARMDRKISTTRMKR